jgi:hypothetical protein
MPLPALVHRLSSTVAFESIASGADGYYRPKTKAIVVEVAHSPNRCVKTLVHELAHALGLGYRDLGRQRAEARVWPLADRADPRALGPVGRQSSSVAASAISSHWACQSSPIVPRTSHVAPASA